MRGVLSAGFDLSPIPLNPRWSKAVQRLLLIFSTLLFCNFTYSNDPVDYRQERIDFAGQPDYQPYLLQIMQNELLEEHFKLAQDKNASINEINEPLHKLSEMYPLGIHVNNAIAGFLEYIASASESDEEKNSMLELSQKKREKANSILQSILSSGDGKSLDTAYEVINIIEEYAVLEYLELQKEDQDLVAQNDRFYDVITANDKNGETISLYFDITIFYKE